MSKKPIKTVQIILLRGPQWKGDPESPASNSVFYFITRAQLAPSLSCQQWPEHSSVFPYLLFWPKQYTVLLSCNTFTHSTHLRKASHNISFTFQWISELLVLEKNFYQTWLTFRSEHQCLNNEKQQKPSTGYVKTNSEHMIHSWSSQATQRDCLKERKRAKEKQAKLLFIVWFSCSCYYKLFYSPF